MLLPVDDEQVAVDFHEAIGLTQGDGGNGNNHVHQVAIILSGTEGNHIVAGVQAVATPELMSSTV